MIIIIYYCRPVGLKNVGNTCYVNSMLQSYFTIPQFRDEILSLPYLDSIPDNDNRRCNFYYYSTIIFKFFFFFFFY